jgi:hypothetical protein
MYSSLGEKFYSIRNAWNVEEDGGHALDLLDLDDPRVERVSEFIDCHSSV